MPPDEPTVDISAAMLKHYLGYLTVSHFGRHDVAPDELAGYDDDIEQMRLAAMAHDDLEPLRLGFDYLLSRDDLDLADFDGGYYPYDEGEVRTIVSYARSVIWPDEPTTTGVELAKVRLVPMSTGDWWSSRGEHAGGDH